MGLLEPVRRIGAVVDEVESEDVIVGPSRLTREGPKPQIVHLQLTVVAANGVEVSRTEPAKGGQGRVGVRVVQDFEAFGHRREGHGHLVVERVLGEQVDVPGIDHPVPKDVVEDGGGDEEAFVRDVLRGEGLGEGA